MCSDSTGQVILFFIFLLTVYFMRVVTLASAFNDNEDLIDSSMCSKISVFELHRLFPAIWITPF